jgi:hypothetical protein
MPKHEDIEAIRTAIQCDLDTAVAAERHNDLLVGAIATLYLVSLIVSLYIAGGMEYAFPAIEADRSVALQWLGRAMVMSLLVGAAIILALLTVTTVGRRWSREIVPVADSVVARLAEFSYSDAANTTFIAAKLKEQKGVLYPRDVLTVVDREERSRAELDPITPAGLALIMRAEAQKGREPASSIR